MSHFLPQDESGERLTVQARFLLDGTGGPELAFLDSELMLPPSSHEDCLLATAGGGSSRGGPGWVAGACLLGLGVATVVVAITVFKSRQSRRAGLGNSAVVGGGGTLRDMGRLMLRRPRRGDGATSTGLDQRKI